MRIRDRDCDEPVSDGPTCTGVGACRSTLARRGQQFLCGDRAELAGVSEFPCARSISDPFRYGSASLDRTWFRKQRLWFAPFGLLDWDFAAWRDLGVLSDD